MAASPEAGGLTVYGAASLGDVLAELQPAWESEHAGAPLTVSTGSSAALRVQIEQGAPADVFMSADLDNPAALVAAGLATEAVPFASNRLTVVVPADNPAAISSPQGLASPGVTIIAAGENVPITRYAEQVVAALARQPGYPVDFAARYESNVASREDNVGAVLARIELGEGDAALVYETDAAQSDRVRAVAIPPAANVVADYAAVVLGDAAGATAALDFFTWLRADTAQGILAGHGFGPPR